MLKTISSITNALGALNYKGTWNASTNSPTLADGTGAKGDYYVVSTAGTQTFGSVQLFFGIGDWIAYNGAVWQRVEGGSDGNFANVTLTSTDAGATAAPLLDLYRDSATPAAADTLGEIEFNGEDSAGNKQQYALIHGSIISPTSGAEGGQIHFETTTAGASTEKMIIGTSNLVINDIGAIYNVRIEGDTDANLFYTDATNSRVGIGTISPTAKLDVGGAAVIGTGTGYGRLGLQSDASGGFDVNFSTGSTNRWILNKAGAETGSDAGSDLILYRYNDAGGYLGTAMTITRSSGAVAVIGALSKGSGSFRIDHPLPEKETTHQLVHSFIEGPQVDLIYRGKAALVNGTAQINIDEKFGMTAGTFVALCRDTQCFTTNEQGWHHVRGSVNGAVLTIECEDATCTDTVSWMVIGERQDKHIMDTDWTDENGKVVIEPVKPAERQPYYSPIIEEGV